jgi:hypothetical protein
VKDGRTNNELKQWMPQLGAKNNQTALAAESITSIASFHQGLA